MKWQEFNLNNKMKVKLNDHGINLIHRHWRAKLGDELFKKHKPDIIIDADGYWVEQTHEIINIFGPYIYNGCKMPFETTVIVELNE